MDCRAFYAMQLVLILLGATLPITHGIVGRDLVLTPKQGLQLNGKSIYYEEDAAEALRNQTTRPWERTLKHVTFVTLFTNAAANAAAGNVSNLREYNDFLRSPYVHQTNTNDLRFGDIVTLASGRLEKDPINATYRFVEGRCDYNCAEEQVWAFWQVQKIRHRDQNQNFRYEMKFSVSPLREREASARSGKRMVQTEDWHGIEPVPRTPQQVYIQKEDDYPHSFGRIIYPDEVNFAKRQMEEKSNRNFGVQAAQRYGTATPMPQATIMRGIFQPPFERQRLNIGEYAQSPYVPAIATSPKIELFPNLLQFMAGNAFATPTTYRPNYQSKFAKPQIHASSSTPPSKGVLKYEREEQLVAADHKLPTPLVTHHFHHHFYMPRGSGEHGVNSGESTPTSDDVEVKKVSPYLPPYYDQQTYLGIGGTLQQILTPPAPQNIVFPTTEVEQQRLVHVTPVPPLKKPQIYPQRYTPLRFNSKIPLLIYPAPVSEEENEGEEESEIVPQAELPAPRTAKPFTQSEPFKEGPIRYSDPDPLYSHTKEMAEELGIEPQAYEIIAPQLEAPKSAAYEQSYEEEKQRQSVEAVADQLPAPKKDNYKESPQEEVEDLTSLEETQSDSEYKPSEMKTEQTTAQITKTNLKQKQGIPENTTESSASTSTSTSTTLNKSSTTTNSVSHNLAATASLATEVLANTTPANKRLFVSTSSTETPLRALGRYRPQFGRTASTTEQPVLKWTPKRKQNRNQNIKSFNSGLKNTDNKARASLKHETKLLALKETTDVQRNLTSTSTLTTTTPSPLTIKSSSTTTTTRKPKVLVPLLPTISPSPAVSTQKQNDIFEVLTQKSVSKSISIKVGQNGEEIPIITDDDNSRSSDKETKDKENTVINLVNTKSSVNKN